MYNELDDVDRTQRELQEVYENVIEYEKLNQKNKERVVISFTQEELKKVCDFFDTFAYS